MKLSKCKNKPRIKFVVNYFKDFLEVLLWHIKRKKSLPPPARIKHKTILDNAKKSNINVFVETGTYLGITVNAVKNYFYSIYSIELDYDLYKIAKQRFSKYDHINIIHGDSSSVLADILTKMTVPCLFWLDAHYSGGITAKSATETPINIEIELILKHYQYYSYKHVILIDDARCFNGTRSYPKFEDLRDFIISSWPDALIYQQNDIIHIYL